MRAQAEGEDCGRGLRVWAGADGGTAAAGPGGAAEGPCGAAGWRGG